MEHVSLNSTVHTHIRTSLKKKAAQNQQSTTNQKSKIKQPKNIFWIILSFLVNQTKTSACLVPRSIAKSNGESVTFTTTLSKVDWRGLHHKHVWCINRRDLMKCLVHGSFRLIWKILVKFEFCVFKWEAYFDKWKIIKIRKFFQNISIEHFVVDIETEEIKVSVMSFAYIN